MLTKRIFGLMVLLGVFLPVFALTTCDNGTGDDGSGQGSGSQSGVYTAGYYTQSGIAKACYWKNTSRVDLPVPAGAASSRALAITVVNGVVYTAGYYDQGGYKACYWTGTTRTDLPATGTSRARAITVAGATVYTAGEYTSNGACYWKGNQRVDYTTVGTENQVNAITVAGGVVYTVGNYFQSVGLYLQSLTCLWTGTERTAIINHGSWAHGNGWFIDPSNRDVYTASLTSSSNACVCKNDNIINLTLPGSASGDSEASAVTYDGVAVYSAGYYTTSGKKTVCYWKGLEMPVPLEVPAGAEVDVYSTRSITASNSKPYTAGSYTAGSIKKACYWTGDTRTDLPVSDGSSEAISIFVSM